jgi:DNA invertase Pin-like site-specific DNA recombinase
MKRYIAYYRVSTDRQGRSGLGLEAQQAAVRKFVNGHGELVEEYTEVETGKRADRPELMNALAHARRQQAILVIAKLDRLARNVAFTAALMESGAEFVACDIPEANRLTIHILAAVAEDEAFRISERTKAALAAYKARRGLLGAARPECREVSLEAGKRGSIIGAKRVADQARAAYLDILPFTKLLRESGKTLREIAKQLNDAGHVTRQGREWNPTQVKRVLDQCTPVNQGEGTEVLHQK